MWRGQHLWKTADFVGGSLMEELQSVKRVQQHGGVAECVVGIKEGLQIGGGQQLLIYLVFNFLVSVGI